MLQTQFTCLGLSRSTWPSSAAESARSSRRCLFFAAKETLDTKVPVCKYRICTEIFCNKMCFHQSKVRKATALFAAQSSAVALLPESSAIIEHVELPTAHGMALLETHFGHIARSECPDPFVDVCLHHRQHPHAVWFIWFMISNNIHQPGMISHWTYGLWAGFQRLKELHQSKLGHLPVRKWPPWHIELAHRKWCFHDQSWGWQTL